MAASKKPKHSKKPAWADDPIPQKIPKSKPQRYDPYPAWRIHTLDHDGPWGWNDLDATTLKGLIISKIADFESMTWDDILVKGKKQNHAILIKDLCAAAQKRLIEIEQDDTPEVVSLRLGGRERIIGIRDGNVLKILWWDPNHEVCPSYKKHT